MSDKCKTFLMYFTSDYTLEFYIKKENTFYRVLLNFNDLFHILFQALLMILFVIQFYWFCCKIKFL